MEPVLSVGGGWRVELAVYGWMLGGWRGSGCFQPPGGLNVYIDTFFIDKYEMSKAKWDDIYSWAVTNGYNFDNAGSGPASNHPVQTINWYDCVKWCNAQSEKEGFRKMGCERLPLADRGGMGKSSSWRSFKQLLPLGKFRWKL